MKVRHAIGGNNPTAPTTREVLPLSADEIERLRAEATAEQGYPGKHGQWERLALRLIANIDALTRREPLDVERLADWMMENLPRVHRWMMVGWRDTMRDEAVALMREAAEYARLEAADARGDR